MTLDIDKLLKRIKRNMEYIESLEGVKTVPVITLDDTYLLLVDVFTALATKPQVKGDERKAFEAWAKTDIEHYDIGNDLGYRNFSTHRMWTGWQARAALGEV